MEKEHKRIITEKRGVISNSVSLEKITPLLKEYKVFNKYMWLDIKSMSDVFELLPSRGPEAYLNIIHILRKTNYHVEAEILEKGANHKSFPKELIYKMTSKPLGYCLIINNVNFKPKKFEERIGSDVDADALKTFFDKIGFEVFLRHDLSADEMEDHLERFSSYDFKLTADEMKDHLERFSSCDFKQVASSIVIILSHGGLEYNQDVIYGIDGKPVLKKDIINFYSNISCAHQQEKPKVFFFIACRGNKKDYGACKLFASESADSEAITPTLSDILIIHSSLPEHISMRDHEKGTWFCQDLLSVLEDCYLTFDLEDIIKMVNSKLMERKSVLLRVTQAAHSENYGFKKFFLFGCPENNLHKS